MSRTIEELLKAAESVAALNKRRTPGEWSFDGIIIYTYAEGTRNIVNIASATGEYPGEQTITDCEMLAHAPEMAQLIQELSAKLREREDVIKRQLGEKWLKEDLDEGLVFPEMSPKQTPPKKEGN